jgi:hypothetical protein
MAGSAAAGEDRPMGGPRKWWWAGLLALAAGCGHGGDAELVPVYGKVSFRGRPLAGGTIVFTPDPERGGRGPLAVGTIAGDGKFTLRSEGKLGVVPGWHRITVCGPAVAGDESALPCRYTDPEHSGLAREVLAGKANVFDLPLE